ncbi:hypothetical protein [Pseudoalteromonas denitrificans]|uniref:Uncharacterized protein n=1 Tax=Pseudoalteromonas denitrificans DSM 6059 TaxID=1123010 RepID=A0A1I1SQW3_9GAMM|nr:hypothetical protein [Pseudoalteromonas denitrificans]SFD48844.1 hypothetical protein SAMN02745724_04658 [Pseudoalteromonas denitrificans DSM 6059]
MTKKRIRIRYRRISLIRPYRIIYKKKAIKKPETDQISTLEPKENNNMIINDPKEIEAELATEAPTNNEQKSEEASKVVSFDPDYNPYAYLVSQLPNMLNAIPNLVGDPKEEEKDDKTNPEKVNYSTNIKTNEPNSSASDNDLTSSHSINASRKINSSDLKTNNVGLTTNTKIKTKKADIHKSTNIKFYDLDIKSNNDIKTIEAKINENSHIKINDIEIKANKNRHTVKKEAQTPKVIQHNQVKSCLIQWQKSNNNIHSKIEKAFILVKQKSKLPWTKNFKYKRLAVRFGGPVKPLKTHIQPFESSDNTLYQQFKHFSFTHKVSLAKLSLIFSSVQKTRNFLQSSKLKQIYAPVKKMKCMSLYSLTLGHYFEKALKKEHLFGSQKLISACLPLLEFKQQNMLKISNLPSLIKQLHNTYIINNQDKKCAYILTIRIGKQHFNIELNKNSVHLYLASMKPISTEFNQFIDLLEYLSKNLDSEKQCILALYMKPANLNEKLSLTYKQRCKIWQPYLSQKFHDFVSSPEVLVSHTKLS